MKNDIDKIVFEEIEEKYGLSDGEAFVHYLNNFHIDIKDIEEHNIEEFNDAFRGRYSSVEEYAFDRADQSGMLEDIDFLKKYFDYKSFANDLLRGGEVWAEDTYGDLFIFEAW